MRLIERIDEDEMVRAFLAADLASPRDCSETLRARLAAHGVGLEILGLDRSSGESACQAREIRRALLWECHGATLNGFPLETTVWYRAELLEGDELYLMDYREFRDWSDQTLRPADAEAGFRADRTLAATIEAIERGEPMPPCICVARTWLEPAVVLDGSQRAVAKACLGNRRPEGIVLGLSPRMADWDFFPRQHIR